MTKCYKAFAESYIVNTIELNGADKSAESTYMRGKPFTFTKGREISSKFLRINPKGGIYLRIKGEKGNFYFIKIAFVAIITARI